jgi:hypothetical protein
LLCTSLGVLLIFSTSAHAQTGVISPGLQAALRHATPDEELSVIVSFSDDVDVRDSEVQALVVSAGASDVVVLWIINSISGTLPAAAASGLADLPVVLNIRLDATVSVSLPASSTGADSHSVARVPE